MSDQQASRTLVKSAPELWAECSDAASLAKHLGAFGEIRITKLEPETAVAWEGDAARGTVRLEPSGWGTRVILTAQDARPADPELEPDSERDSQPESVSEHDPERDARPESAPDPEPPALKLAPAQRPGLLGWISLRWRRESPAAARAGAGAGAGAAAAAAEDEEEAVEETVAATPASEPAVPTGEVLHAALDSLGSAHHRPYSRA